MAGEGVCDVDIQASHIPIPTGFFCLGCWCRGSSGDCGRRWDHNLCLFSPGYKPDNQQGDQCQQNQGAYDNLRPVILQRGLFHRWRPLQLYSNRLLQNQVGIQLCEIKLNREFCIRCHGAMERDNFILQIAGYSISSGCRWDRQPLENRVRQHLPVSVPRIIEGGGYIGRSV